MDPVTSFIKSVRYTREDNNFFIIHIISNEKQVLKVSNETHQIALAKTYFNLHNCEQAST